MRLLLSLVFSFLFSLSPFLFLSSVDASFTSQSLAHLLALKLLSPSAIDATTIFGHGRAIGKTMPSISLLYCDSNWPND